CGSMSRSLLGCAVELYREVDEPLDLPGVETPREGGHRSVALPDATADRRAVAAPHHGRGEEVQVRIEEQRVGVPLAPPMLAMAAGAVGRVELRRRQVPARAAGPQRTEERQRRGEEQGRPELQTLSVSPVH